MGRVAELNTILSRQPASGITAEDKPVIGKTLYGIFGNAGKRVYENIQAEANLPTAEGIEDAKINDFAATLIWGLFKKFEFGWFISAFAVGDGGIAVYTEDGDVKVLNQPDGGEYAGQTRFVTMAHIWEATDEISTRMQVHVVPNFTAIVAMSDGVSDPKFGTDSNFFDTQEWHKFWKDDLAQIDLKNEEELLKWLDFWSAGNHDDRTLAIGLLK